MTRQWLGRASPDKKDGATFEAGIAKYKGQGNGWVGLEATKFRTIGRRGRGRRIRNIFIVTVTKCTQRDHSRDLCVSKNVVCVSAKRGLCVIISN